MVDQAEIHRKSSSNIVEERIEAVRQIEINIAVLPDKEQAWADLHRLTTDEDIFVHLIAASSLGQVFPHVPDKKKAWIDLLRVTKDKDSDVRCGAALGSAFPHVPDKKKAWADLLRLTKDKDSNVRCGAASSLGPAFSHMPDKEQAWTDLHRLTKDKDSDVRSGAASSLDSAFPHVPDKEQAWTDLHRLTKDKDSDVRRGAASSLGQVFSDVPDKKKAWIDLLRVTKDEDSFVRFNAVLSLRPAFPHVPDKKKAWIDLLRLTKDEDSDVRYGAASSLGQVFSDVPDKKKAWANLHRLTKDKDSYVRRGAALSLGPAFPHVPDKKQAWADLHRLIKDKGSYVRRGAALSLGPAFPHVPDKKQAWADLLRFTKDEDSYVRVFANHTLGRASIFRATGTEREEEFRKELENALFFFERASTEATFIGPPNFCLPFYRSFYTLTFKKQESEAEVQRYLAEAKSATEGSENKEQLLEAIENLANALKEVHDVRETDFGIMKRDLNAYRRYCDRAADLLDSTEEKAPGATKLIKRGLPIIDKRIKEIISEIQERARAVCKQTHGMPLEELGQETIRYAQELPIKDPLALTVALGNMGSIARDWCEYIPTDKKIHACEQLKNLREMELSEQGTALAGVFEYINTNIRIPRIQPVHISKTQQEIVRVAVVQFCFELTESFPFAIKNKDEVKTKIFSALDIAKEDGANIVCLPELCLCEEWVSEIKEKYPDMIVIGGSFYKDDKNISSVIMESNVDIPCQPKITPSASEYSGIMESRMIPGDRIYRYETPFGKFVILICRDFDNFVQYFRNMVEVDIIFCPAFNPASERFHKEADVHVEKIPSYVLIANAGLYGGTSIFGQLNRNYFSALVDGGCKDAGDLTYKLCEVKKGQEEVIIADFNLIHKSVQVPTPSDPNEEIRSVENIKKNPIQLKR